MRSSLQGRGTWVIPMGGSSWLGSVGYVNAGLELAAQIEAGDIDRPDRIYVATGTMGTAAGLALGLALANIDCRVQAVRVSHDSIANRERMDRLLHKTAMLMHRIDPRVPQDLASPCSP